MAVSNAHWFDYEVILLADANDQLVGKATSLQATSGALPGLAGLYPTVTVCGDTFVVESQANERPPARLWDYLTLFVPFAHGAYIDRCLRAAQVRAFELELPGLVSKVQPGHKIRLKRAILSGPGYRSAVPCEVTLFNGVDVVHVWSLPKFSETSWTE